MLFLPVKSGFPNPKTHCQCLEFTSTVPFTLETILRMRRQYQFNHGTTGFANRLGVSTHNHAFSDRSHARCRKASAILDFHYTHSAGSYRAYRRMVAESGDIDPGPPCRIEHHVSLICFNLNSVDCQVNLLFFICHHAHLLDTASKRQTLMHSPHF